MKSNPTKTFKESEEAPSGSVYFYNYKEPLMKFKEGFGYVGALIHDETSNQVQCHFCGNWFDELGNHLHKEHNMTAGQYKEKVGLNKSTALVSETFRAKLIARGLEARLKNLRPGGKVSEKTRQKIAATLRANCAEKQNQRNTCPEQLIERLVKIYNKVGRTPRFHGSRTVKGKYIKSEVPFVETLIKVYGSVKNACKVAGIPYRSPSETVKSFYAKAHCEERVVSFVREFFEREKRIPMSKEYPPNLYHSLLHFKVSRPKLIERALSQDGVYKKVGFVVHYNKETLIDFLKVFSSIHKRKPSYSDCKHGLLPPLGRYSYNFGSWKKALKVAFPETT